jgi:hypothetical protein
MTPTKKATRNCVSVLLVGLMLLLTTPGCATLFAAGPDTIPVQTNPPGAWVYVNGMVVGQTPTTISLDRSRPGQIQIYLPGFQPVMMIRSKTLNGWFIVSILFFLVPIIVDLATGNWQRYDDGPILIGLTPAGGGQAPPPWFNGQGQPPMGQQPMGQPPMGQQPMGGPPAPPAPGGYGAPPPPAP